MRWFQDAWDHYENDPKWRISYTDAFSWINETDKLVEPGITPRHSEDDLRGMGIRKDYPPGVVIHEVYHFIRPDLEEPDVTTWALNQVECYEMEEEDDDDDSNNENNNGSGGGGNSGEEGGGSTQTCTTGADYYDIYVYPTSCGESDGEDGGSTANYCTPFS